MIDNKKGNPFLSIVICSRNDNHGGNMLPRMQVSLNGLLEQLDFCKQNIIRINSHSPSDAQSAFPELHTNACGDFQLMSRYYWHLLRGYRESDIIVLPHMLMGFCLMALMQQG